MKHYREKRLVVVNKVTQKPRSPTLKFSYFFNILCITLYNNIFAKFQKIKERPVGDVAFWGTLLTTTNTVVYKLGQEHIRLGLYHQTISHVYLDYLVQAPSVSVG